MYSGLKNQTEELVQTNLQLQFAAQYLFIYLLLAAPTCCGHRILPKPVAKTSRSSE
jgi:hypothetical protein